MRKHFDPCCQRVKTRRIERNGSENLLGSNQNFCSVMLHSLACRFSHIRSVSTHTRGSSVTPSTGAVLRNLRPRNAMKRTINDFFAPTPTKKAKYVEPEPGIYIAPVVPPETSKPAVPVPVAPASQVPSSSNELSPEELALIESNRKKALAKQLFNRITEPSWREALEAGAKGVKTIFPFFPFSFIFSLLFEFRDLTFFSHAINYNALMSPD